MKIEYLSIKRDGLNLHGKLMRSDAQKGPIAIMFHGFTADLDENPEGMFELLSKGLLEHNISTIRFDFNGHGKSDGDFSNMNVLNEINDAIAILEYVRKLDFVTDIYVVGHSQGGVVGGMLSGYYKDVVKKLVLLEPAAILRDDAIEGHCAKATYDPQNIPDYVDVYADGSRMVGGHYFRIAQLLPIYEVTAAYKNPMLLIHGEKDEVVAPVIAHRYKEHMDNCRLKIFDNIDHCLNGKDHDAAIALALDFLLDKTEMHSNL